MKAKEIKKSCLETGRMDILTTTDGKTWISNGRAYWPMPDIDLTEANAPAVFDMSLDDECKIDVRAGAPSVGDYGYIGPQDGEIPLYYMQELGELMLLSTEVKREDGQAVLIHWKDLIPARVKGQTMHYFLRKWTAKSWIVVGYNGMEVGVLAMPEGAERVASVFESMRMIASMPIMEVEGVGTT